MAIFGNRSSRPAQWLAAGLRHTRRVGQVERKTEGLFRGVFSGILLDGEMLSSTFADLPLFLTCRHGFLTPQHLTNPFSSPLPPIDNEVLSNYRVIFEGMFDDPANSVVAGFAYVLADSPPSRLNFALLLMNVWPGIPAGINLAPRQPPSGHRVYIIGYPRGESLSVSLEDNEVVERDTALRGISGSSRVAGEESEHQLFYLAPTEAGSSGSPVFNEFWELAALHVGKWPGANVGVRIDAVLENARQQLAAAIIPVELLEQIRATRGQASRTEPPADFFSVFISYSHADAAFADRLYNALQAHGVRAWLDRHQMQLGDDIYEEVDRGIQMWDKVLLCCSQHSLTSWWVDNEIDTAFEKERVLMKERGHKILAVIPLNLDDYMFSGKWLGGKSRQVKSRLAANFNGWEKDDTKFEVEFERLLQALKTDESGRETAPPSKL